MSLQEWLLCRSMPWRLFTARIVLPWALQGAELRGEVLELGSGSGAMAAQILRRFPDARMTATDYDERMVEQMRAQLAPFGTRASAERADATSLPFADGSFDLVLSFMMLHHVGRWEQALAEAVRVLRPGGRLIAYDLLSNRPTRGLHRVTREHGERLIAWNELEPVLRSLPVASVDVRRTARILARLVAVKAKASTS